MVSCLHGLRTCTPMQACIYCLDVGPYRSACDMRPVAMRDLAPCSILGRYMICRTAWKFVCACVRMCVQVGCVLHVCGRFQPSSTLCLYREPCCSHVAIEVS